MSSGRGWIALVAVYLGGRRPGGVLLACLFFGLLIALSNAAQGIAAAPAELLQALPYLATAIALVAWKRAERRL
jgi:simple sugar transport system permease protein